MHLGRIHIVANTALIHTSLQVQGVSQLFVYTCTEKTELRAPLVLQWWQCSKGPVKSYGHTCITCLSALYTVLTLA